MGDLHMHILERESDKKDRKLDKKAAKQDIIGWEPKGR